MKIKQIPYQVAIIVTLCVYLYYLVYRVRYTINPDCLILSLGFFYAEVHGFVSLFLFFCSDFWLAHRFPENSFTLLCHSL